MDGRKSSSLPRRRTGSRPTCGRPSLADPALAKLMPWNTDISIELASLNLGGYRHNGRFFAKLGPLKWRMKSVCASPWREAALNRLHWQSMRDAWVMRVDAVVEWESICYPMVRSTQGSGIVMQVLLNLQFLVFSLTTALATFCSDEGLRELSHGVPPLAPRDLLFDLAQMGHAMRNVIFRAPSRAFMGDEDGGTGSTEEAPCPTTLLMDSESLSQLVWPGPEKKLAKCRILLMR